jgi:glycosyltransferase involved in cell wall biosynthesis
MERVLASLGGKLTRIDVVGRVGAGIRFRPAFLLFKTCNILVLWLHFITQAIRPGQKLLYISTAGGYGKLFELPFLAIARILQFKMYIHHHSFAYLLRRQVLTAISFRIAGKASVHIALCQRMRQRLIDLYDLDPGQIRVLSNSGLMALPAKQLPSPRTQLHTLGFLGNISDDKGIQDFIAVCEQLQHRGIPFRALIAGPYEQADIAAYVSEAINQLPGLAYLGPLYDDDKFKFLDSIDLLLFPSKYRNEAEPLVIYEANSRGVHVIATNRGCIPEALRHGGGEAVTLTEFVPHCIHAIQQWQQRPDTFTALSHAALMATESNRNSSVKALNSVLTELSAQTDKQTRHDAE